MRSSIGRLFAAPLACFRVRGSNADELRPKEWVNDMLLVIDLGNTNLTLGLYDGDKLGAHWRLATDHARMPDEYGLQFLGLLEHAGHSPEKLTGVSLASVVPPLTGRILQACRQYLNREPLLVDAGVKTGIKIRYEDPRAVGADRVADAVAVMHQYGGPACVVDFGTATTFNALTRDGEYLGGAITVGINLAAEALFTRAAKLPRIDLQRPPSVIGRNTVHAMNCCCKICEHGRGGGAPGLNWGRHVIATADCRNHRRETLSGRHGAMVYTDGLRII
jgi:type III pantothenate kinase